MIVDENWGCKRSDYKKKHHLLSSHLSPCRHFEIISSGLLGECCCSANKIVVFSGRQSDRFFGIGWGSLHNYLTSHCVVLVRKTFIFLLHCRMARKMLSACCLLPGPIPTPWTRIEKRRLIGQLR